MFFIIDRSVGYFMEQLAQKPRNDRLKKLNYIVNDIDEEILLFGTSRILHAFDPTIIKDSVEMSIYNCGISGGKNIYTHYMLLNYLLKHHVPRIIVLEINPEDFLQSEEPYSINKFSHFYGRDEVCDSFMTQVSQDKGLLFSNLYRYNVISKDLLTGLFRYHTYRSHDGYEPRDRPKIDFYKSQLIKRKYFESNIDYKRLEICDEFFSKCLETGIQLILVTFPEYTIIDEHYFDPVRAIAEKYQIPFFDYHYRLGFENYPEYFVDKLHLNTKGAEILSSIFAHDLKAYLNNDNQDKGIRFL